MNLVSTTIDRTSVRYFNPKFDAVSLDLAEATYREGTLFGRRLTANSIVGTPTGTGTRVQTMTPRTGRNVKVGTYTLLYGNVTTGAGPATLTDPDGLSEAITIAATGAQEFPELGVTITIGASGTIFDDGDSVAFVAASAAAYVPFAIAGSNGAQTPVAVLTYEIVSGSTQTLAGSLMINGDVVRSKLVVHADGDADNLTQAHVDALRLVGINVFVAPDTSVLDNL